MNELDWLRLLLIFLAGCAAALAGGAIAGAAIAHEGNRGISSMMGGAMALVVVAPGLLIGIGALILRASL